MKATDFAAYESPKITLITFTSEGVLCSSTTPKEFGWNSDHDGFSNGGDLEFSDWSD